MNPAWLVAGLLVGERISPTVRAHVWPVVKTVVRESYWAAETLITNARAQSAYHRWLDSLPTTKEAP